MSTGPTSSPAVTPELHKISQYLTAHEKLIIVVLCVVIAASAYWKAAGIIEGYFQRKDTLDHAALQAQVDTNKGIAEANAKAAAQYQALAQQLAASNAALVASQAARDKATVTQQQIDRTLPPTELAARWEKLLSFYPGTVQPTPGTSGALVITPSGAQETVAQLEDLPTLRADLKDEQNLLANEQTQFASLANVNVGLNKQIDGLNIAAGLADKACTDDKNLLKAQARKSKMKWAIGGIVTGLGLRGALKIFTGI